MRQMHLADHSTPGAVTIYYIHQEPIALMQSENNTTIVSTRLYFEITMVSFLSTAF